MLTGESDLPTAEHLARSSEPSVILCMTGDGSEVKPTKDPPIHHMSSIENAEVGGEAISGPINPSNTLHTFDAELV